MIFNGKKEAEKFYWI